MFKGNRLGRGVLVALVVSSLMFGATAAFAAETDRAQATQQTDAAIHRPIGRFGVWVIANTMQILDASRGEVVSTLAHGKTLADLAGEKGSSGEALVAELVAIAQRHADAAVEAGKATEEQAARFMERITAAIENAVFEPHHPGDRIRDRVRRHLDGLRRVLWHTTLEFLDASRGEVVSTLAQGKTLADLAGEKGSSGEAIVAELVGAVDDLLSDAVDDGRITDEQKDRLMDRIEVAIDRLVFEPHRPGRGHDQAG